MIIFINYDVALEIARQVNLIIVLIDKLNLPLIRALNYIQRFELKLRYKLENNTLFLTLFLV